MKGRLRAEITLITITTDGVSTARMSSADIVRAILAVLQDRFAGVDLSVCVGSSHFAQQAINVH